MTARIAIKRISEAALIGLLLLGGGRLFAATSSAPKAAAAGARPAASRPAEALNRSAPWVAARAVVVMDQATGEIVYGRNPDLTIPPASLTKLVSLHVVYEEIKAGRLSEDEILTIDKRDCSPYIPYGSSLMYLRPGMRVSVRDLMRGAAVVSGNDAAFALARRISGSNEAFAERMNAAVRALGLRELFFVEPSGLSELNSVTARCYAEFCRLYIELHPQSLAELHSVRYIEFPRPEHFTADYHPDGRIIQYNRNNLVLSYPGCDGLKTGYIIESGYNLAATAKRGDTRFIVVTLGGGGEGSPLGGTAQRSHDGVALFDWAFSAFETARPAIGELPAPRAWYGAKSRVKVSPASALAVTLPRFLASAVQARVDLPASLDAPLKAGERIGEVVYSAGGQVLRRVDLVAAESVPKGNVLILIRDAFAKFFSRLFGKA
jgi:serine-type D-Ala-D-Ala carboxypeptidase (penicillin-binding protein 5/6)